MIPFDATPICEECHDETATSFSHVHGKWMFTGQCTSGTEDYYIEFKRFFRSPASTIDWLAHMNEKNWMDWTDFMNMMDRFRSATKSFHKC